MISRVSAALSQFIKPISSSTPDSSQKPFERFTTSERRDSREQKQQNPEPKTPDNVISLDSRRPPVDPEQAASQGVPRNEPSLEASTPLLQLFNSLKGNPNVLAGLSGMGRKIYARVRRDQGKARLRKGAIVDVDS